MALEDIHKFSERLRDELDSLDVHHETDQPAIKRYVRKKSNTIKESTLWNYLSYLRRTAEYYDGAITEMTPDDLDAFLFEIQHDPELGRGDDIGVSRRTARNYQENVVMFLRFCGVGWVEDYEMMDQERKTIDPGDMLEPEDIRALVDACHHPRDVAMIEFLADTGARLSMMATLRVQDVDLDGERATYQPNPNARGLKDAPIQPYPIIDSKASLRAYLRFAHPRRDDPNVALFHKMRDWDDDGDGDISPGYIHEHLHKIARRAGIDKPVNPHSFRHSAISRMWREGYSKQQIQHRVAWVLDTNMWETYVHVRAEDMNETIFADAGHVEPEESDTKERKRCGNCRELLAAHHPHCPNCGEPATPEARAKLDRIEGDIFEYGMNADTESEQEAARALREALKHPRAVQKLLSED